MEKSIVYFLILTSFAFLVFLFSYFSYPIKNILAQIKTQDLIYQPPSFGIKINYPPNWKANSDEADPRAEKTTIVTFIPKLNLNDTDGAVKVWVNNNPPTYNLQSFLQDEINNNRKNDTSYIFGSSTIDTVTLAGYPAFTHSYTTKINGQEIVNYEIGSIINGKAYEITYYAKSDEFSINLVIAYRLINSFQVLTLSGNVNGSATAGLTGSNTLGNINNPLSSQFNKSFNPIIQNQSKPAANSNLPLVMGYIEPATSTPPFLINDSQSINQYSRVTNNNYTPIADTGQPQEVNANYVALLNGSKSYDPDGDPITFSWRQIGGPVVILDNSSSPLPTFITPNIKADTKMKFELTVKDPQGLDNSSIVTVTDKSSSSISDDNTTRR